MSSLFLFSNQHIHPFSLDRSIRLDSRLVSLNADLLVCLSVEYRGGCILQAFRLFFFGKKYMKRIIDYYIR